MFYSKKVLQHFKQPHNQGVIKNADAIGEVGNPI
ncbi:iron-sulfur cluster assembly scaffold protein, partial [Patescibacteria group bacterium]|nr:iron-sulfur cluster assembly scaffold protein [Patescibacteria group bacterium]